ncbi:MAG: ABC transporter ATP-binding protein [Thiothrix sp.]|uniref:ABC transporter ATP-binding protein n=1 Tax=Thiothrix sp. TaxID=1032 RepID=UPI002633C46E|nr:ABC transporter ATP-binding protein [Thiothrix sp.]MDD5394039.1 ABC transporter ATP-binding protein [Thiothrix sp.]
MQPIISVENLSKQYIIGHQKQERHTSLRDELSNGVKRTLGKLLSPFSNQEANEKSEQFWALKDISFDIQQGDRVGIIGRNGAGKSTLLKILSRITEPTSGRVKISGRVASLLEVGTGFHPELTGRENIYLNGAILGMSKAEIKRKFDEIVDFAEVEKFLDTPVKRYSSGMYVRLAFAVAANLEPEILIVDEVLAVGDVQFQKKCLGKMNEVSNSGKTILLVSHNIQTILSLSNKVLLLAEGKVIEYGYAQQVVTTFQNSFYSNTLGQTDITSAEHYGTGQARFRSIFIQPVDGSGKRIPLPLTGCNILLSIDIETFQDLRDITVAITIYDDLGNRLIDANTLIKGDSVNLSFGKLTNVTFTLENIRLKPDTYTVGLWMGIINQSDIDGVRYATSFRMNARHEDILYTSPFPGVYACKFQHEITQH